MAEMLTLRAGVVRALGLVASFVIADATVQYTILLTPGVNLAYFPVVMNVRSILVLFIGGLMWVASLGILRLLERHIGRRTSAMLFSVVAAAIFAGYSLVSTVDVSIYGIAAAAVVLAFLTWVTFAADIRIARRGRIFYPFIVGFVLVVVLAVVMPWIVAAAFFG